MVDRLIPFCVLTCLLAAAPTSTNTLSVVGVAVNKGSGQRMAGVTVKLVATARAIGVLAEDRTSAQGVFNLYATNIAGAIGDLYVIYDGSDAAVSPLKVSIGQARNGFIDVRPGDLVFLPLPATATLNSDEAAERLAAVLQTQAVLSNAGVIDQAKSDEITKARAIEIRSRVSTATPAGFEAIKVRTNEKLSDFDLKVDPSKAMAVMVGRGRGGHR